MPDDVIHVPGVGLDGAHDAFLRIWQPAAALPAAAATGLINATPLPAAAAVWTPISAITLGAATVGVYAESASGHVNKAQAGVTGWKLSQPRNLQIVCSGGQTGDVVITGLDRYGNLHTETLVANGATPVLGSIAFEWIFSVAVPEKAASETISVGTGAKISLPWRPLDADSELRVYVDTTGVGNAFAKGTNGTIDATHFTYIPNHTPDGTALYRVVYQSID